MVLTFLPARVSWRMRIGIGSDHRGFRLKETLKTPISSAGHQVRDFGCSSDDSVDYPDFALPVARAVAQGRLARGILICSSGVGMSIAANKVRGVRAALCFNRLMAVRSRAHNNANVLCLGADFITGRAAKGIVRAWLATEFEGGRHQRRLRKIALQELTCRTS